MNTAQKPKALELADRHKYRVRALDSGWNAEWNRSTDEFDLCVKSESELRRQHAEIERLTAQLNAKFIGLQISVDVSTGDEDAGHRLFGTVTGTLDTDPLTLLCDDAKPNFQHRPPITEVRSEQLRDAFSEVLTDSVYVCTRVWSAWGYGTMTEDDFTPANECEELLDSLIDAAHGIGGKP